MKPDRIVNITMLGGVAYLAALPVVSRMMRAWFPVLWSCSYRRMTGRFCPFCGTTRDLNAIWHGRWEDGINPMTPVLVTVLLLELAWRLWLLRPGERSRRVKVIDAVAHGFLVAGLIVGYWFCWNKGN